MEAIDKLITARVRLQKDNPFFSYLTMGLELKEDKTIPTCAVDGKGNLFFNPEWVDTLDNDQVKTVLAHEVLHIALQHLSRRGKKDARTFNIAGDIVVNNLLEQNEFYFGNLGGLVPQDNEISVMESSITNIDKKIAEEIYAELKALEEKEEEQEQEGKDGNSDKQGENNKDKSQSDESKKEEQKEKMKGFDDHIYSEDEKTEEEKKEAEKVSEDWKKRLAEASTYAKLQGKLPKGLKRYVDEIFESKLNWRALLHKYITREIITDYTWSYPSKKSVALGTYLPSVKKEQVDITIAVDTSGSVSKKELQEFLSEIVGISKGFANIRLNILFADTKVNNHYVLDNGNTEEILDYKIEGGGGTDFRLIYDYLDENIPNTKLLVFFTDGYAHFPDDEFYKTVWVLTPKGCDEENIPFGEVIKLEDRE